MKDENKETFGYLYQPNDEEFEKMRDLAMDLLRTAEHSNIACKPIMCYSAFEIAVATIASILTDGRVWTENEARANLKAFAVNVEGYYDQYRQHNVERS